MVERIKINYDTDENKNDKKIIKDKNYKYLIYKKYLEELDRKSSSPIDLNTLSL